MKRQYLFGTMMAITLAFTAAGASALQDPTTQSAKDEKTVTVTGCLMPGAQPATPSGTAGTTGTTGTSSASASNFILTNAKMDSSSASTTTGTSGSTVPSTTSGTASSAGSAASKSFTLLGGDQSDLQKFVNSKVEIRGTIDRSAAGAYGGSTATGTTPPSSNPSTASGMAASPAQQLRVTSVRQVSESCSGGQQ